MNTQNFMQHTTRLLLAAVALMTTLAHADYPDRPVRLVVPFAAGGATDVVARALAGAMSKNLGQQIVIDNRPGAGGVLAANIVAKAPADGYTLLVGSIGLLSLSPNLRSDLPYNPQDSFAPVVMMSATPNIIVANPQLKAATLRELMALAKASPGKIAYASSGLATSTHLSGELFQSMAGIELVHVPYKGGAPALNDLLAGQVLLMFDTMSAVQSVKAGKLRALAITGDRRSPLLPDVPTVAEAGLPGYVTSSWNGLMAPAGTPAAVIAKLNAEANRALAQAEVQKALTADGSEPRGGTAAEFGQFISAETRRWGNLIKSAGIKAAE